MLFGDAHHSTESGPAGPAVTVPVRYNEQVVGYVRMTNRFPFSAEPLQANPAIAAPRPVWAQSSWPSSWATS